MRQIGISRVNADALRFARRACLPVALCAALLSVCVPANAQAEDVSAPDMERLFLTVVRNQQVLDLLVDAKVDAQSGLSKRVIVSRADAAAMGLDQGDDAEVDLSSIAGLSYEVDRLNQRLVLTVDPNALRSPVQIIGAEQEEVSEFSPGVRGVVLDYDWSVRATRDTQQVGGWGMLKSVGFSGQALTSFRAASGHYRQSVEGDQNWFEAVRLDSAWVKHDPHKMITWEVGDAISGGLEWSRPVRFAGFRVGRNFALQPYRATTPRLAIAGSAALPSTVELFLDGVLTSQEQIVPGSFELNAPIPVVGSGVARVVLTDLNGLQQVVDVPLYGASTLLEKGLMDGSFEAGFLRKDYGIRSHAYQSDPMSSGTLRYGISDFLTAELHAEVMDGAGTAGIGAVARLPARAGVFNASVSKRFGEPSQILRETWQTGEPEGQLQKGWGWQWNGERMGINVSSVRRDRGYFDIAANAEGGLLALASDQVWLGLPTKIGQWNAGYVRQKSPAFRFGDISLDERESRFASLSWSSRNSSVSTSVSVQHDLERGDTQGYLTVSIPLEGRRRIQLSRRDSSRRDSGQTTMSWTDPVQGETTDWGWRAAVSVDDQRGVDAAWLQVDRLGEHSRWSAGLTRQAGETSAWSQGSGGWVLLDGLGSRWMRQTDGAFALVDTGGVPGVPVRLENRRIGETNEEGKLLVERLRPWQRNRLSVDTERLPIDVVVSGSDTQFAVPRAGQGAKVKFELMRTTAFSGAVSNADDQFISAGSSLRALDADGQEVAKGVVGNDGAFWIETTGKDIRSFAVKEETASCIVQLSASSSLPARSSAGVIDLGKVVCLPHSEGESNAR